jgi:hypothetical protein
MKSLIKDLRPLRIILFSLVLISIIFKQATPDAGIIYEGWGLFSTLLIPVFAPIFVMLLWLDSLMATLWLSQAEGKERSRYKMILRTDLILSVIFVLVWVPYFMALSK